MAENFWTYLVFGNEDSNRLNLGSFGFYPKALISTVVINCFESCATGVFFLGGGSGGGRGDFIVNCLKKYFSCFSVILQYP